MQGVSVIAMELTSQREALRLKQSPPYEMHTLRPDSRPNEVEIFEMDEGKFAEGVGFGALVLRLRSLVVEAAGGGDGGMRVKKRSKPGIVSGIQTSDIALQK